MSPGRCKGPDSPGGNGLELGHR